MTATKRYEEHLVPGFGMAGFWIRYDTRSRFPVEGGGVHPVSPPAASFGDLWESNLHKRLVFQGAATGNPMAIQASRGTGVWIPFLAAPGGGYTADASIQDRLVATAPGWRYTDAAGQAIELYSSTGEITSTRYANGVSLAYTYSDASTPATTAPTPGLLIAVQDQLGRTLQFTYELPAGASGARIKSVIDATGQTLTPTYTSAGMMGGMAWQDASSRSYVYETAGLPWALTGVIDENASRFSTYAYDTDGRAFSTELAGAVNRYSVSYTAPPRWAVTETYDAAVGVLYRDHTWQLPTGASMTGPSGSKTDYTPVLIDGMPRLASQSQPAGAGCAASTSGVYYDAGGQVRATVDFNSTKTCFDNDATRRLETARVEGLNHATESCQYPVSGYPIPAASVQRKVSTQWHPVWNLESRRAEPKVITTWVYNGQPDPTASNVVASCAPASAVLPDGNPIAVLCKHIEQATTDTNGGAGFAATASGAARVTSYTYNAFGQVLTARDPRGNTTTSAYYADTTVDHTLGDLQSVTNAAGHVTQYTVYDKSGRLKRSIDPNGVVTAIVYTPRGWVSSVTVTPPAGAGAAQTMSYVYDGVGQLKEATLPDASKITYTYDAAHRLTGVKDGAGNTVAYTLDNLGNRTGEQLKDPAGVLARNITRVYDALNRLQSVTGAQQ